MTDNIEFTLAEEEYGLKTYQAVVENTSEVDFENYSLTINLLDSDGVIVETTYASVSDFKIGAKAKLEFMTDKDFKSTEIEADWCE